MQQVHTRRSLSSPIRLLARGFENQMHVVGALILRELHTRFGRDNIGYLWIIAEPMLLAIAVAVIHLGVKTHFTSGMRTVPFTLLGYCMFMIFRSIFMAGESTLVSNQPLLFPSHGYDLRHAFRPRCAGWRGDGGGFRDLAHGRGCAGAAEPTGAAPAPDGRGIVDGMVFIRALDAGLRRGPMPARSPNAWFIRSRTY